MPTTTTARPMFLFQFPDGTYLGAGHVFGYGDLEIDRVSNPERAGVIARDQVKADAVATSLGGVVVAFVSSVRT